MPGNDIPHYHTIIHKIAFFPNSTPSSYIFLYIITSREFTFVCAIRFSRWIRSKRVPKDTTLTRIEG